MTCVPGSDIISRGTPISASNSAYLSINSRTFPELFMFKKPRRFYKHLTVDEKKTWDETWDVIMASGEFKALVIKIMKKYKNPGRFA